MKCEIEQMQMAEAHTYNSEIHRTYVQAVELAAKSNERVVVAGDYTLQMDIDTEEDFKRWEENSPEILRRLKLKSSPKITVSKGGLPHRHITITLDEPMDIWARIALQVILGSDFKRELFNSFRVLDGIEYPVLFFEPKE